MKKRTKRILALLLAIIMVLQQGGMTEIATGRTVLASESEPDSVWIEENEGETTAGIDAEDTAQEPADTGAEDSEQELAGIGAEEELIIEPEYPPQNEPEAVPVPAEWGTVLSELKLDNSAQTALDNAAPYVALDLMRPDGFSTDVCWKLEVLQEDEKTRLTAGTDMEQADGLVLRFSVEENGSACDLAGTEAALDGLDSSYLTGAHLSLYRDGVWPEQVVQFSDNGGTVRASFSVDGDGVLFFWKETGTEEDAETEQTVTEAETDTEQTETVTETEVKTETETEIETETVAEAETESEVETEIEQPETVTEPESETEAKTETETEIETETETEIETETETETESETEIEIETEAGSESATETEPETETEAETAAEIENGTETEDVAGTEIETEAEIETETETESESETEIETETEEADELSDDFESYGLMQIDADGTTDTKTFYEVFYNATGKLVFQNDKPKESEDYIIYTDDGNKVRNSKSDWPFDEVRLRIQSVEFLDDVPMTSMFYIFGECTNLSEVNIGKFTAKDVKSFGYAFYMCSSLESLDLTKWDTSSATYISYMFRGCNRLVELDVSNWNTSSVTDFQQTFRDCSALKNLDVRNWIVSGAKNLQQVFFGCKELTALDLSNWDTGYIGQTNVDMNQFFSGCTSLSQLKLGERFVLKNNTSLNGSWKRKTTRKSYTVNQLINSYNNDYNSDMADIYHKLITITFNANGGSSNSTIDSYVGDTLTTEEIDGIPTPTRAGYEFAGWWTDPNDGEQLTAEGTITQTDYYAHWEEYKVYEIFYEDTGELIFQNTREVDSTKGTYVIYEDNGSNASAKDASNASWAFHGIRSQIKSVVFRDNVKLQTLQFIFKGCSELLTVNTTNYHATGVTSIAQAFYGCTKLQLLDLSNWDVSAVTNMGHLVRDCTSLQSLNVKDWDTSSVNNINSMFRNCSSLEMLDVSGWDTSGIGKDMQDVFYDCKQLKELDMSNWTTKFDANPYRMFFNCSSLRQLKLNAAFVTTATTEFSGQWKGLTSGQEYDEKDNATSLMKSATKVSDTYVRAVPITFHGNGGTPDKTQVDGFVGFALGEGKWNTLTEPTHAGYVFNGWWTAAEDGEQLTAETLLTQTDYYAHWKKDKVYEILYESGELVFQSDNTPDPDKGEVRQIFEDDGSNAGSDKWEFDEMRDLITSVSFRDNVKLKSLRAIFKDCRNLSAVDVRPYDATGVTTIAYAFSGCESLTSLNLNTWNTSSVTYIGYAFQNCKNLRSLEIDRWSTDKVWNMYNTFNGCSSLETLDVSGWNTATVSNMIGTFGNCSSLTELNLRGWNTKTVASGNMSGLFAGCTSLYQLRLGMDFCFHTNAGLDGQWKRGDDGKVYSGAELMRQYDGTTMADIYHRYVRVSFNGNGGIASPQSIECYLGETVDALPTAEWEGYHFRGWFTERNGGEKLEENGPLTQAIYYAHWEPYTYTLRLNAMNGDKENNTKEITLTFDEFYQLSENEFTYEEKFLLGWNTKRDGSGEMYGPNSRVSGLADQDGSTVNLYAIWGDPDDYVTLTFDSGFDSADEGAEVPSMRFKKGETVEAKHLPQSTREGYRFEGWSYEKAGKPISDKDRVELSEDKTLYAVWKEYLTVTFDPKKEGLASVEAQAVENEPLEGSLPNFPQREDGSILIGWFTEDGNQVKIGETFVTENTTFYAHWGWRPQFDTAGGKFEVTPEIPFAETSDYTLGALPKVVRDGYKFDAWYYVDGTGAKRQVSEGDMVELGKDTRIVARWTPDQKVKITLDPGEGTIDGKDGERILNAYVRKAIGDLPVPKREGYVFMGWQDGSGELYDLTDSFSEDKTLTAKWAKELTVTFMDGDKPVTTLTVPEGGTIPSLPGVKVDPADTTRNDKILEGWYTEKDGLGTKLLTETAISEDATVYYAHWKEFKKNGTAGATSYTYGIEWNSASNENVDNVDGHLVFHPTDYRPQTAQLHVHFQLNVGTQEGGSTIPKGGVKIKIPRSVWRGWNRELIKSGNVPESLSEAAGNSGHFGISDEESNDEYYVLVNNEPISGGTGMDATFSYKVDPNLVPGGGLDAAGNYVTEDLNYYHDTFQVTITVDVDPTDSEINKHTEELFIEMHTRVRTFASKEFVKMYPSYSNSWKDTWGPKPADADDYFYIEWKLKETSESTTNQPFTFTWSEENTVHDGTVVGYLNNDGTKVNATGHEVFDKQRVLVKYPRTMLAEAKDGKLPIHNEAIVTENWQSGYETSHRVSADYTLKVPTYSGGGRGLDKISFDVANSRNISRPAQKHGGQEDILIDENEVPLGWRVSYSGGAKTQPLWYPATETYTRSERTIRITDGMEKSLLYSSGSAGDDRYSWNPSTGNVELSDEDYRFTSVKVNLKEYDMVSYGDTWSEMAEHENIADYEDVYLFVRYKDSDKPVFFARAGINVPVSLPENVCGIEIRHDSSFCWTDITVDLGVNLRPSAAVSKLFKEDVGRDTTSIVKNWACCQVWASGQTDPYVNVTNKNEGSAEREVWEMDISDTNQFLQKTATTFASNVILDVKHGTQDSPMCLYGWLYNNGGRTPRMQTGVFYDLLPMGTTVDPETVYGVWTNTNWSSVAAPGHPANNYKTNQNSAKRLPSAYIDVKFESNWEGSQRTMMIIEFALPEGVKANGVQIYYLLRTTYENIMENGATQQNSAAFVNTTELSATPKLTQSGIEILSQDEKYFKSLDTEYSGRISYSEDSENYIPVDVSTWGFDKQVKAETGSSYVQKDNVLLNDTYTYRLIYSQGSGTHTKGIVFLDVLENGYYEKDPTSESGKKLIGAEWQGTFENINVESIRKLTMIDDGETLHCNPVVYYSTADRDTIEGADLNLLDTTVWTTDPLDKKAVTAIAVDCSMCEDGRTPFELKGNVDAMEIYITMRAPTDAKYVDQTTRNRAVLNMTHVDSERSETAVMMDAGASVVLKDVTPELHKTSDPGSGTDTNPAPVYKDDQLTYTLSVKNTGEEAWLDDIVLKDAVPEGLSVQNSNIRVRFGADAFTAIEGVPRVKLSRTGQELTFRIGMLYPGETVEIEITGTVTVTTGTLINTAQIVSVNDVEKTVKSETTYHEVTPIGFNISKTGVGGRPLAGARLQLWRLNGDAEVGAVLNTDNYTMIGEWESDGKVKTFTGQSKGIYVLHEVSAPPGHLRAEDITMELDSRGNLTLDGKPVPSVTMKDDYTKVSIEKKDHTGHAVKGAKLAIYDYDSFDTATEKPKNEKKPVEEWETDGSPHELNGVLKAGEKYILYEAEAPEGYRRAKYEEFEVPSDGSHRTVTMTDPFDSFEVKIRKVDPDGNSLAGAKLRITGKKKEEENEISPIEWDTTVEDHTVKLYPGDYKLSEVFAPDGYAVAEPIEFKVEEDTTNNALVTVNGKRVEDLTLVMEDKWAQDLTVTKTVKGEEPEDSGEKKEYSFTLTLEKADGSSYTEPLAYKKRVKSVGDGPDTVTSGMISATEAGIYQFNLAGDESFTFVDVPQGLAYVVDEISKPDAGYVVTKENDRGTTNGFEATKVNITNTYPQKGDLLISKTVIGSWAPPGEIYTVKITPPKGGSICDDPSSELIRVYKMSSDGKTEEVEAEITQEHIIVKLAGGEQIVVRGLKPGTIYTVTEIVADPGSGAAPFTTTYKVDGGDESVNANVEIAENKIGSVEVRNTYPDVGELTIGKTVSGGPEPDDNIWYTVRVSSEASGAFAKYKILRLEGEYRKDEVTKAGLQFQLRKDSEVTISGLPVGTYTVRELVAGLECISSYTVTADGTSKTDATGGSVTLSRGTGASDSVLSGEVQILNRYPDKTDMTLTGTKAVIGKPLAENTYEFTVKARENPGGGAVMSGSGESTTEASKTTWNQKESGKGFEFGAITFVKAGTYVFEVSETASRDPEVARDSTVYTVTVEVETKKDSTTYAYEITRVVIERTEAGGKTAQQVALYEKSFAEEAGGSGKESGGSGSGAGSGGGEPGSGGGSSAGDTAVPIPSDRKFELPKRTEGGQSATFINRVKHPLEMPDTGGPGTLPITWVSILLCLAGCFILLLAGRRKPRGSG